MTATILQPSTRSGSSPSITLTVERVDRVADGVVSLTLVDGDGADLPTWDPGAHIDLHLPLAGDQDLVRQYSLCGDIADRTRYRVAVLRERDGGRGGSAFVHDELVEGAQVGVTGPRNSFALVSADSYLFLAGGIGITPLLSMVAEAERRGARWTLHYGGRDRAAMAFLDELAAYAERVHVAAGEDLDLDALLTGAPEGTHVYACGPPGMLGAVEDRAGLLPRGTIHLEKFRADSQAHGAEDDAPVRVVCETSGVTVDVAAGVPILNALEAAGLDVPNSCREGTCGTCETAVLRGTPDHRDSVLSPDEQEAGDTMMVCVSRAVGDELVLDL